MQPKAESIVIGETSWTWQRVVAHSAVFLLLSALCTGCWDATEVNRLAIITMSGWDAETPGDPKSLILGSVDIARPGALGGPTQTSSEGKSSSFLNETGLGTDVGDAFAHIQVKTARRLYLDHRNVAIIGEPFGRLGVSTLIDEMARNPQSRLRTYLLVAHHSRAADLLRLTYPLNRVPSQAVVEMLQSGTVAPISLADFIRVMTGMGDPYLMGIQQVRSIDQKSEYTFDVGEVAVFQKDRLVGWLNRSQSEGLLWVAGKLHRLSTSVTIPDHIGHITLQLVWTHTDQETSIRRSVPHVQVRVYLEENVTENGTTLNLQYPKNQEIVTQAVKKQLTNDVLGAWHAIQAQYDADSFNFGELLYEQHPAWWRQHESQWRQVYRTMTASFEMQVLLRHSGMIGPSIGPDSTMDRSVTRSG